MKLGGVEVGGHSIGGISTCIDLPRLKLCFDIGRCPEFAVNRRTVLFTHAHVDHMGGVISHAATRGMRGMPAPRYVVPHEDVDAFEDLFDVWRRLDRSELAHETIVLGPGEELRLTGNRIVRPFRSPHRAPCQGYAIWTEKKKLKARYAGLPPDEIVRLRTVEGVEVEEVLEAPLVAFTGDSRIDVVEREEVVRRASLLILEVTFLDDRVSVAKSRAHGHVHLDEVIERAELFENEAILMTHFSARYGAREVAEILERRLPEALRGRVHALVTPGD